MLLIWHRLEECILALLLAAMTLLTFVQVVLRYVFNSGFVWALETTTYLFAWLVLFGMSYGVRAGAHIGIDAAVKLMPAAGQRVAGLIASALGVGYCVLLFIGAWNYTDTMMLIGVEAEDIPVERWKLSIILPIGFALLGIRIAEAGIRILRGAQTGMELGDEARQALAAFRSEGAKGPRQ